MSIIGFMIQILSGAMLLLFAVRLLRSGIERQFGAWVHSQMNEGQSALAVLVKGAGLGFVLQGGTVVLLMAGTLASQGIVPLASAALLAIGAELGSAIAVQALHLSISSIGPFLVLVGGWCYLNTAETSKPHNIGRILLGLGLVFLALSVMKLALAPLQSSPHLAGVLALIGSDLINAALLGLVMAFIMHSSLAAMLTAAVFAAQGDLSATVALGFMLGCNMGSAVLPVWLLRSEQSEAKVVAHSVAILRISLAVIALAGLIIATNLETSIWNMTTPVAVMLLGHCLFNLTLWPFVGLLPAIMRWLQPEALKADLVNNLENIAPELALSAFKRKVNVMLEILGEMVANVTSDDPDAAIMAKAEDRVNQGLTDIRKSYVDIPTLDPAIETQINNLLDYAIRLERAADILSGKYMEIRAQELNGVMTLSDEGAAEVAILLNELQSAMILSQHVFWKEDPGEARLLIERKQKMARLEQTHKRQHFNRIRAHHPTEIKSSNQYLELSAALKEITSKLATIGYVVLDRHGGLKKTRLKQLL